MNMRDYRLSVHRLVSAALAEAATLAADSAAPRTELQREAVALWRLRRTPGLARGGYTGERLPLGTVVLRRGGARWRTVVGGDMTEVAALVLADATGTDPGAVRVERFVRDHREVLEAAGFYLPVEEVRAWVEVQQ